MAKTVERRQLYVYADWQGLPQRPQLMGILSAVPVRGKEVFSFSYDVQWLAQPQSQTLDPSLQLFAGPQYLPEDQSNFGLFLNFSPDRWGRLLIRRREAALARQTDVARAQGLSPALLGRWQRPALAEAVPSSAEREESKRLRAELKRVEQERDMLKKVKPSLRNRLIHESLPVHRTSGDH